MSKVNCETSTDCNDCCTAACEWDRGNPGLCRQLCMNNCKNPNPPPNPNCDPNDPTTVYQCDFDNCIYNATNALVPFLGKTDRANDIKSIAQFSCGTQPVGKGSKSKLFDIAMQWWNFGLTAVPQMQKSDLAHQHCQQDNVDAWWSVASGITAPLDTWNNSIYPECQKCTLWPSQTCPTHDQWCKSINYNDGTCEPQYCKMYGKTDKACEKEYCQANPNDKSCPKYCKSVNETDPDCPGYCDTQVGEADKRCASHCQTQGSDDPNCPQYCTAHPTDQGCACKANPNQKICNGWCDAHPDDKGCYGYCIKNPYDPDCWAGALCIQMTKHVQGIVKETQMILLVNQNQILVHLQNIIHGMKFL